jgi:hypothetical protein
MSASELIYTHRRYVVFFSTLIAFSMHHMNTIHHNTSTAAEPRRRCGGKTGSEYISTVFCATGGSTTTTPQERRFWLAFPVSMCLECPSLCSSGATIGLPVFSTRRNLRQAGGVTPRHRLQWNSRLSGYSYIFTRKTLRRMANFHICSLPGTPCDCHALLLPPRASTCARLRKKRVQRFHSCPWRRSTQR